MRLPLLPLLLFIVPGVWTWAHDKHDHYPKPPPLYEAKLAHAPTPLPDRIILTWDADPVTTQTVTWRTDTTVSRGLAQFALANSNGWALQPKTVEASTQFFESDLNSAHYHTVRFTGLEPETLYTYRVGDGTNWSEYFHFQTASEEPKAFRFIYFGDAQNDVKTHWSRVFREAFREAPRAAFTLHAGDLVNDDWSDREWGEWFWAPAWVNATIPVIATPGNHEYYRANEGPAEERFWNAKDGTAIPVQVVMKAIDSDDPEQELYQLKATDEAGNTAVVVYNKSGDLITYASGGITTLAGYMPEDLIGTDVDELPLDDRQRNRGIRKVSDHWRPSFAFPLQDVPAPGLEETVYYIDYQGVRIISLDSLKEQEAQVPWLIQVLENNPNRWTILTFHHPIFSPASDRDNPELRELWKPIFDQYKVDLVLNGHDHTYARTGELDVPELQNIPTGYQQAYDPEIGTVYVVSVSGPKMYNVTKGAYAKRVGENTQLYQIIEIEDDELRYEARTATNRLYDAFTLKKRKGQPNQLLELLPPENRE